MLDVLLFIIPYLITFFNTGQIHVIQLVLQILIEAVILRDTVQD